MGGGGGREGGGGELRVQGAITVRKNEEAWTESSRRRSPHQSRCLWVTLQFKRAASRAEQTCPPRRISEVRPFPECQHRGTSNRCLHFPRQLHAPSFWRRLASADGNPGTCRPHVSTSAGQHARERAAPVSDVGLDAQRCICAHCGGDEGRANWRCSGNIVLDGSQLLSV